MYERYMYPQHIICSINFLHFYSDFNRRFNRKSFQCD